MVPIYTFWTMVDRSERGSEAVLQVPELSSSAEYISDTTVEDTRALLTHQSLSESDGDTGEQGR